MFASHNVVPRNSNDSDSDSEGDEGITHVQVLQYHSNVSNQREARPIEEDIQKFMKKLRDQPSETLVELQNDPKKIFDAIPRLDSQSETDRRTVLHCIVEEYSRLDLSDAADVQKQHAMIQATKNITRKYPCLLGVAADDGTTPLYRAIVDFVARQNDNLIRPMIWQCKKPKDIQDTLDMGSLRARDGGIAAEDHTEAAQTNAKHPLTEALEIRCSHGVYRSENVLHLALRSPRVFENSMKALLRLVKHASEESVLAKDADGLTPVHYAANYAWSSNKAQEDIIKNLLAVGDSPALIEEGKGVLDVQTNSKLSIFRYHVETRNSWQQNGSKSDSITSGSHAKARVSSTMRLGTQTLGAAYDASHTTSSREAKGASSSRSRDLDQNNRALGGDVRLLEEHSRDDRYNTRNEGKEMHSNNDAVSGSRDARESANTVQQSGSSVRISQREGNEKTGKGHNPNKPKKAQNNDYVTPGIRRAATGGQRLGVESAALAETAIDTTAEDNMRFRDECSDALQMFLKVYCLRTRSHERSAQFLYGSNSKHIQTWFDYQEVKDEIDMDVFVQTFQDVEFDTVLKYVALPPVRVRKWDQSKDNDLRQTDQRGRSDMLFFFNWLRKEKGVKHILKVIIRDSAKDPHSDEAIEMCLKSLGVEFLDWSKPDLDPDTIHNAAPNLTQIVLRWSGNNATLRAWGEPEGLRRLPYLKDVFLLADHTKMLESQQRVKGQVESFKRRLKEACPRYVEEYLKQQFEKQRLDEEKVQKGQSNTEKEGKKENTETEAKEKEEKKTVLPKCIAKVPSWLASPQMTHTVECFDGLDAYGSRQFQAPLPTATSNGDHGTLTTLPHRWLDATDDFSDRIKNIWAKIMEENKTNTIGGSVSTGDKNSSAATFPNTSASVSAISPGQQPREVIVALIDDGVDTTAQQLSGKILTGLTFASAFEGDRNLPWYVSETGHGTVMASMITRVCPMAKIYPIRLDTGTKLTAGGGAMVKADSAPDAIRAAVHRGASIISMSWSVTEPPYELKVEFDQAIQYALSEGVLLMCSSSDLGHGNNNRRYPAAYQEKFFVKIGAAQPSGLPYDWVGDLSNVDFILPGVEVVNRHPQRGPGEVKTLATETGSSVATALGAGLAALIIYCARINQMYGKGTRLSDGDVTDLLKAENMIKAMSNFGVSTSKGTEGKFIEVWNKLDPRTKMLATFKGTKARDIIAELARDIIAELARDLISPSTR